MLVLSKLEPRASAFASSRAVRWFSRDPQSREPVSSPGSQVLPGLLPGWDPSLLRGLCSREPPRFLTPTPWAQGLQSMSVPVQLSVAAAFQDSVRLLLGGLPVIGSVI